MAMEKLECFFSKSRGQVWRKSNKYKKNSCLYNIQKQWYSIDITYKNGVKKCVYTIKVYKRFVSKNYYWYIYYDIFMMKKKCINLKRKSLDIWYNFGIICFFFDLYR